MIFEEMARPKPVPDDLVVKFGAKTFSYMSSAIPMPLSSISTMAKVSFL